MSSPAAGRPPTDHAPASGKYLSFRLSKEEYGVSILRVREIIGMVAVTPLPRTPSHVRGVINLRGRIIPVIDLRLRFGMAAATATNETCIVVVDGAGPDGSFRVGCVVDSVSEVLTIATEQVEPTPRCANAGGDYLAGLAKLKDRVLILLDVERVLGDLDPATLVQGT